MVGPWFASDRPRSEKKLAAARCDKHLSGAWWGFGRVHDRLSGNPSKKHTSVAPPWDRDLRRQTVSIPPEYYLYSLFASKFNVVFPVHACERRACKIFGNENGEANQTEHSGGRSSTHCVEQNLKCGKHNDSLSYVMRCHCDRQAHEPWRTTVPNRQNQTRTKESCLAPPAIKENKDAWTLYVPSSRLHLPPETCAPFPYYGDTEEIPSEMLDITPTLARLHKSTTLA